MKLDISVRPGQKFKAQEDRLKLYFKTVMITDIVLRIGTKILKGA